MCCVMPPRFAGRDLGRADGVEQARLAVVDVAHDRDDRGARLQLGRIVLLEEDLLRRLGGLAFAIGLGAGGPRRLVRLGHVIAELAGDERRGVAIDELVDRREDPALDELADHVGRVHRQQLGQFLDGDRRGQLDRATLARVGDLDLRRVERAVATRRLAGPATAARAAPTPGHGLLLRWSCSLGRPLPTASRAGRGAAGSSAPVRGRLS